MSYPFDINAYNKVIKLYSDSTKLQGAIEIYRNLIELNPSLLDSKSSFFGTSVVSPSQCPIGLLFSYYLHNYLMTMSKNKKSKKCSSAGRKILWYFFGAAGLGARAIAALALLAIAIKVSPLKYQAKSFNACVEESRSIGKSISASVNYCNGGS